MKAFAIIVGTVTAGLLYLLASGLPARDSPASVVSLRASPGCVPDIKERRPWARGDLERELSGRTTYEVCMRVGAPRSTSKLGEREFWYYRDISIDPHTGQADRNVQVVIDGGKVESVNF